MLVYGRAGWSRFDSEDVPGSAGSIYVRVDEKGRVVELVLAADRGREITAAQLRRLPLSRLTAMIGARADLLLVGWDAPDPDIVEQLDEAFPKRRPRKPAVDTEARLQRPVGGRLDEDFLRQVAAAYTAAVARGDKPNQVLAQQVEHDSTRTVERWVYLARKQGLLPKARPGAVG